MSGFPSALRLAVSRLKFCIFEFSQSLGKSQAFGLSAEQLGVISGLRLALVASPVNELDYDRSKQSRIPFGLPPGESFGQVLWVAALWALAKALRVFE